MSLKNHFPLIEKKQSVFGLDIGRHEVKFVQLKSTRHGEKLVGLGSIPLSGETVIEGIIAEPEALADTIIEGLAHPARGHINSRVAIIGLPQAHLFSRIINIPAVRHDKLKDAVLWEAQQYIPMPISDLYTDHEIVKTTKDETGVIRELEIVLVAAPRAIVDSYIKLCQFSHIQPRAMEVSLNANIRALHPRVEERTATLMIDAGSVTTDMAIITDYIQVTTTVNIGGDSFTDSIVKRLKITTDQAEEIKLKFGVTQSDLQSKILEAVSPHITRLSNEIAKLIKYYEERSKSTTPIKVSQVMITGGGSRMPGLAHIISQKTQLPVDISSPWDKQKTSGGQDLPKNLGPIYTTAYGLAMRGWN
ncbi:MAG: type IV pilus assembly protein PilM [bacterium]